MALSGSKNFAITRSDIIEAALRKLGVYDQAEPVDGDETVTANIALNLMIKEWVADGIDIWLRQEVTLFLQPGTKSYNLGTANATTSFVESTLSADEAAAQTALSITDTTGMTAADFVGIKLDSNKIHWTTITTVNSSTQITVPTGLPTLASSGNKVYAYTTKAGRPQKLLYAYRRDTSALDTEVTLIGENEYQRQTNKGSSGPPVEVWYRPTMTTGTLFVWPVDGGSTWDKLVLIAQYMPDDFDTSSNNPQFPIEWGNVIIWNLAAELASEYGIPEREQNILWRRAQQKLDKALDYDAENADVVFSMESER